MSPFTCDAAILEHVFGNKGNIWKDLSGPILSIRIFDRIEATQETPITKFKLELKTDESAVRTDIQKQSNFCINVFSIEAKWDFMIVENVEVKKIA